MAIPIEDLAEAVSLAAEMSERYGVNFQINLKSNNPVLYSDGVPCAFRSLADIEEHIEGTYGGTDWS